jgi:hypothetical protein
MSQVPRPADDPIFVERRRLFMRVATRITGALFAIMGADILVGKDTALRWVGLEFLVYGALCLLVLPRLWKREKRDR